MNDPTPLTDLTDEQWREMGFEPRYGLFCNFWQCETEDANWLHWCRNHGLVLNGKETKNVKTLGQLRALMYAIGESNKFNDQTPLSKLTDEQWQKLGFQEWDKNSDTFRHRWESGLYFYYPEDDLLFYDWVQYPTIKTLGQLRALMFAIGD